MALLDSSVVAFAGVALILTLTPGSDTLLVIKNTLEGGKRSGLIALIGILSGGLVHASAAAVGLSAILRHLARSLGLDETTQLQLQAEVGISRRSCFPGSRGQIGHFKGLGTQQTIVKMSLMESTKWV